MTDILSDVDHACYCVDMLASECKLNPTAYQREAKEIVRKLEQERNAFRAALKQIQHNPGWQDPEVGFLSGHIAAGVLNQFPETLTP